jgi:hypothetical protein
VKVKSDPRSRLIWELDMGLTLPDVIVFCQFVGWWLVVVVEIILNPIQARGVGGGGWKTATVDEIH